MAALFEEQVVLLFFQLRALHRLRLILLLLLDDSAESHFLRHMRLFDGSFGPDQFKQRHIQPLRRRSQRLL